MKNTPSLQSMSPAREAVYARGMPVLGVMVDLQRDRLKMISDMRDRGDVVRYSIAGLTMYQINHPAGIQRVLQDNNRNYPRGKIFAQFRPLVGNGLLFSDGEFWLRQRRLMSPAFHPRSISGYAGIMSAAAQQMAQDWHKHAARVSPVDINQQLTYLTMQVVSRALFSADLSASRTDLGDAITQLLDGLAYRFDFPFYPPLSFPTPRNLRFREALHTLDQTLYAVIRSRRAQSADQRPRDFLTMLVEAQDDDGQGMDDVQLRDEVLTMFAAGHETTANALTWAFSLLAAHPEIDERLHAELESVLGDRDPVEADFASLPLTRHIIDETLRLYPPAWVTNRQALAKDELVGVRIPAGATITLSPYAMHRHPQYWQNPHQFDPDRFLPERSANRPRYAYFPFGGGPHLCIGQGFALMEAVLVMAVLSRQFRLRLAPGFAPAMKPSVTLRPKDGMWMIIEERK